MTGLRAFCDTECKKATGSEITEPVRHEAVDGSLVIFVNHVDISLLIVFDALVGQ